MSSELTKQARPDKRQVYVIWTNKGGVGKTTLSFHIATTFAKHKLEEGWKVLVCDLCPQAKISRTLLTPQKGRRPVETGSVSGADSEAYAEGADNVEMLCHERLRPDFEICCTVAGYIQSFVSRKAAAKVPPMEFLIKPCKYNEAIPENMYLLCGDPALGVSCERLERYRRSNPGGDGEEPWRESTLALREFVDAACNSVDPDANWLVIIDTNSALTTYTQLALVAADKIIMPVNSDEFSKVAVKALFDLLYSTGEEEQGFSMIRKLTFAYKVKEYDLPLPRVRLVVNNRQTMYQTRASYAFCCMRDMIGATLFDLFKKYPDRFVGGEEILMTLEGHMEYKQGALFRAAYTADLQDFHSTAVLCTHMGLPLSVVATGNFNKLAAFRDVKKEIGRSCLSSVAELSMKMLMSPAETTGTSQQSRVTSEESGRQTSLVMGKPVLSDTTKTAHGQRKSAKFNPALSHANPTSNQQISALTTARSIQHTTSPAATGATLHPMAPVQEPTRNGTSRQPQVSHEKSGSQTDSAKTPDTNEKAGGQRFSVKSSSAQSDDNPNSNQRTGALATENGFQHTTLSSTPASTEIFCVPFRAPAEEPTSTGTSKKSRFTPEGSNRQTTLSKWATAPLPIQGERTFSSTSDPRPSGVIMFSQTQVPIVVKHESASLQQWPFSHQLTARISTAEEGMNKGFSISQRMMATQQSSATSTAVKSAKRFLIPSQTPANPHRTTLLAASTASPHICKNSQPVLSPEPSVTGTSQKPRFTPEGSGRQTALSPWENSQTPANPHRTTLLATNTASSPVSKNSQLALSSKQLTAPTYLSVQRPLVQTNRAAPVLPRTSFTGPHPEPSLLEEPSKRPRYDNPSSCG